jgi:hypothetical protein
MRNGCCTILLMSLAFSTPAFSTSGRNAGEPARNPDRNLPPPPADWGGARPAAGAKS